MNLGRFLRTIRQLHPLQLAARAPHRAIETAVAAFGIPSFGAPEMVRPELSPRARDALAIFGRLEAARYTRRLPWLRANPKLAAYEARYALDLAGDARVRPEWTDRAGTAPYVAAVRARRIASALASLPPPSATELFPSLVTAARAVLVAPELHLLGNHLLEDAIGLVSASGVAKGVEADLWWELGRRILDWQLPIQFYLDGMHDEGSMSYHLWLAAGLVEALTLARANNRPIPESWDEAATRALDAALLYRAPDGTYPLFNDASYDAAPTVDEVISLARSCGFAPHAAPQRNAFTSQVGWAVLNNEKAWLVLKAGPDGSKLQPGHVHADMLSIELWVSGAKVISDPGVTSYNADVERDICRGGDAHNGPHEPGEDSSEVWSAFRTGRRCHGHVAQLTKGPPPSVQAGRRNATGGLFSRSCTLYDTHLDVVDCAPQGHRLARLGIPSVDLIGETESQRQWQIRFR